MQRDVEWKKVLDESITTGIVRNSLFFHDTKEEQAKAIKMLLGIIPNGTENTRDNMDYQKYIKLLCRNYNLVLTGAPGTGKTYIAKEIAKAMGAETKFVQFHPSFDYTDFVEGLRPMPQNEGSTEIKFVRQDGVFKAFCKEAIHAKEKYTIGAAYDSFVKSINKGEINTIPLKTKMSTQLSVTDGDNIKWYSENENDNISSNAVSKPRIIELFKVFNTVEKLENMSSIQNEVRGVIGGCNATYFWGVLHYLLENYEIKEKPFVFIIDEINRGEASKIFGELFYAIDPGYRGKKEDEDLVQTQYQNLVPKDDVFGKGFYVPDNVYVLATMNDIDRSVESMDFAMRRRFTWVEVKPADTESMLNKLGEPLATEAKTKMKRLNDEIARTDGLGSAYSIGPAYFKKMEVNGGDFDELWDMSIEPLLREYLRGFRDTESILETFKKAYNAKTESIEKQSTVGVE